MGEHGILSGPNHEEIRNFTRCLLDDLWTLEQMIRDGKIESGVLRIGAEQEMFLVDEFRNVAPVAAEVLKLLADPLFNMEIAKFNLEANLPPLDLAPDCLRRFEKQLLEMFHQVRRSAGSCGADVLLTGILPTLRQSDLTLNNLSDAPRYHELNRILTNMRGNEFQALIRGIDEITLKHDNVMLEACNTSFQFHVQIDPSGFADAYNSAQVLSAPLLAGSANSPLLFHRRLWQETRLALVQHSVDDRSATVQERSRPTRVSFGEKWVQDSVLEIYREDLSRFRVLLTCSQDQPSSEIYSAGGIPEMPALRLHTGTIWRWNRPCYGILNGKPHLRIENRVLPAGPTILDETANSAFFLGALQAFPKVYPQVHKRMPFDHAKSNLIAAARYGLHAGFHWFDGNAYSVKDLLQNLLIPMAKDGLQELGIDSEDRDRFLGVFEERVKSEQTGAMWILQSCAELKDDRPEVSCQTITEAMLKHQLGGKPVHRWEVAQRNREQPITSFKKVGQLMSTDLYTIRPDDLVDLAAGIMDWEHVRHVPVENEKGQLIGIVSYRDLIHYFIHCDRQNTPVVPVREIMKEDPVVVSPETSTLQAIRIMRKEKIGCLPVVADDNRLVGIVTLYDVLALSAGLLEQALDEDLNETEPTK